MIGFRFLLVEGVMIPISGTGQSERVLVYILFFFFFMVTVKQEVNKQAADILNFQPPGGGCVTKSQLLSCSGQSVLQVSWGGSY